MGLSGARHAAPAERSAADAPANADTTTLLRAISAGQVPVPPQPRPRQPTEPRHRALPLAAVLLLAGVLLAAAVSSTRREAPDVARQRAALREQIAAARQQLAGLTAARTRLSAQLGTAGTTSTADAAARRRAAGSITRLSPVVGTSPVRGPGLTVRLDDAPSSARQPRRISDADLQQVVNQLWAAGAEAVAINNVRLTGRTAIRTAGDAILVGFRPQSPPYTVSAIGSPSQLSSRFAASPLAARLRRSAAVSGTGFSVHAAGSLTLPAAADSGTAR